MRSVRPLVAVSRGAFVEAFQATALASAAIALIAVLTVRVLGRPKQNAGISPASDTVES